ncbi:MAG: hypothetical protein NC408_09105 [Candidatus Gastranaerophilales bacterium]|nr:hypothetical protein [Candidatus Gastranaerophilales bacterium]MCM1073242.1 hypothetical protein [Bacteroides sp.]
MTMSYPAYQPNMYPPPLPYIKQKKEPSAVGASIGALVTASIAKGIGSPIIMGGVLPAMKKNGQMPQQDIDTIHNAAAQTLEETGLKKKGVRIRYLDKIKENITDSKKEKPFLKTILDAMYIDQVREGNNAFFAPTDVAFKDNGVRKVYIKKNSIIMPKKDISGAVFHEMGHAMNYHFSTIGKALQKLRPLAMLGPTVIGLYGACSRKSKPTDGQELSSKQKTNNFIRDNAGLLAFATTTPMLIEEGMATVKGQKFADKFLSKELAAKVSKGNKIAYCSYALSALCGALSAFAAVKTKDSILGN